MEALEWLSSFRSHLYSILLDGVMRAEDCCNVFAALHLWPGVRFLSWLPWVACCSFTAAGVHQESCAVQTSSVTVSLGQHGHLCDDMWMGNPGFSLNPTSQQHSFVPLIWSVAPCERNGKVEWSLWISRSVKEKGKDKNILCLHMLLMNRCKFKVHGVRPFTCIIMALV